MQTSDETFLDDLLDRLVAAILAQREVDLVAMLGDRVALLDRAREVLMLARTLCGTRARAVLGARRIGGLEIVRELGRGASSVVYLARQAALGGRAVALKVLSAPVLVSASDRRRFLAEARALARVRHPHVVEVLDVIDDGDTLGYTMPWVRGSTLAALVTQRVQAQLPAHRGVSESGGELALLPPARWVPFVCRAGVALARALAAVHAASMLHRDVKPGNVLLDEHGKALLADFGLVRDADASMHTRAGAFLGTLAYAAPEQVRGEVLDVRADVYGLGATLYHAFTLRPPARGQTPAEIARCIETGAILPLRRVDPRLARDLETVVGKAMAADATMRYADADAFADELQRVLDLQPILARPPSPWARAAKFVRRNRRSVVAGIAGAALTTVLLWSGWLFVQRQVQQRQRADALAQQGLFALLDPELRGRVQAATRQRAMPTATLAVGVERALTELRAALALDAGRTDIAVLCDLLAAARDRLRGTPVQVSADLARACPQAARVLRQGALAPGTDVDWSQVATPDLRAVGLAAYLGGAFELAVAALEQFEQHAGAHDPFVDGLLGQVNLALGHPERAYPRLLRVADLVRAGHLDAAAADAAVRCGDTRVAERLLVRAKQYPTTVATPLLMRIAADLAWLEGRGEVAFAAYDSGQVIVESGYLRRTQYLEASGRTAAALLGYINLAGMNDDEDALRGVLRLARRHWAELSGQQRRAALLGELSGERVERGSLFGAMAVVGHARSRLRAQATGRVPPTFAVDVAAARLDLDPGAADGFDALASRVASSRADLAACQELSPQVRTRLVDAWLDASASAQAEDLLRAHGAVLRDGDAMFVRAQPVAAPPWQLVAALPPPDFDVFATFGEPLATIDDVDGDAHGDVLLHCAGAGAAGARSGVRLCSGASGAEIRLLTGNDPFARMGWVLTAATRAASGGPAWLASTVCADERPSEVSLYDAAGNLLHRIVSPAAHDSFGRGVAWLGDVDGDHVPVFAVSAPGIDPDGEQRGRVDVYSVDGQLRRSMRGAGALDSFGEFLASVGDIDGDGAADFAAGTSHRAGGSGYVLVVSGRDGRVLLRFAPDAAEASAALLVAAAGDVDADGRSDVAVAWRPRASAYGRCVVLSGRSGVVLLSLRGQRAHDGFGADLTGVGDIDGDGRADLAVSSWSEDSLRPPSVHLFSADGVLLAEAPLWWRLRRLAAPGQSYPRFAALALGAWTRYAEVPLAGRAHAAVIELRLAPATKR